MFQKLKTTIRDQLSRGVAPRELALSVAFAVVFASLPVLGFSTLLCFAVGVLFRLNHPLLQTVNYLMAPVQILMMPVFLRIGEKIYGAPPMSFSPSVMMSDLTGGIVPFFMKYGMAAAMALTAWCLLSPLIGYVVFQITKPIFRQIQTQIRW